MAAERWQRMTLNGIKQKSFPFSVFRFPFFANFAKIKANGQWLKKLNEDEREKDKANKQER